MSRLMKSLLAVSMLVLLAMLLVFVLDHLHQANGEDTESTAIETLTLVCSEGQVECSGTGQSLGVRLNPVPATFPALKPLTFTYLIQPLSGIAERVKFVSAKLAGRDMFMGEHMLVLEQDSGDGRLVLSGMVPVCVTGSSMVWRVSLLFEMDGQRYLTQADLSSIELQETH